MRGQGRAGGVGAGGGALALALTRMVSLANPHGEAASTLWLGRGVCYNTIDMLKAVSQNFDDTRFTS